MNFYINTIFEIVGKIFTAVIKHWRVFVPVLLILSILIGFAWLYSEWKQAESERDATRESLQKATDKANGLQIIINAAPQAAAIQKQKEVANAQSQNSNTARANLQKLSNVNYRGINGKDLDRLGDEYK